ADSDTSNNNTSETTTVNVLPQADLSITQTESSDPVFTGAALSYTLTVNNAGPNPASTVEVTDSLPSGVVFGSATDTDWTCNESSGTVTCTLPSLNVGAANPITINVTAPGSAGSLTNTATISATTADSDTSNNNTSETTTVNVLPQADLSITQTESSDPVFTGAALSYTLIVNNAGPDSATDVQVTDTLPSGVVFGSATGTDWTCNEATGTVTCTLASLNVGAANPITINLTAPGTAGNITNTATISATTTDPDTSNNNVSENTTVNVLPQADLSITQSESTDPVFTGAALSYTLIVNNAGPDSATDVQVTNTLPSNVVFSSASGTDWTCNESAATVTCTIASLNTGAANPITINLIAPGTAGSLTNTATITATTADPDTSNNNVSESTTVNTASSQADLSITQTDSSDPISTSDSFSYTLTVNNAGPATANDVQVIDTLPSNVTFGSASGTDWTCNQTAGTVTCTLASLNTGAANPITINLTAPGTAGNLTNTATVSATTADPDTSNNNVSESTTVNIPVLPPEEPAEPEPDPVPPPAPPPTTSTSSSTADLSIAKTDSSDPVKTGQSFSYVLTVSNAGPNTASDLEVIDTLPSGLNFVSVQGNGWHCQESSHKVTCLLDHLRVGSTSAIILNVTAPSTAGKFTNTATVYATTGDPDTGNNSIRETTTVKVPIQADVSISQTESSDPVKTGHQLSYTLNVKNAGPNTANTIKVIDTLPKGVIFESANGKEWTCQESGSEVSCTLASLSMGAANPITLNLTAPSTAGSITNTATVSAETADPDTDNNSTREDTSITVATTESGTDNTKPTVDLPLPPKTDATDPTIVPTPTGEPNTTVDSASPPKTDATGTVTTPTGDPNTTTTPTTNESETNDSSTTEKTTVETLPPKPDAQADLSLTKTHSNNLVFSNDSLSYSLTVNNNGPDTATNIVITETLPEGVSFVSASGNDWTCQESGRQITCTLASLELNEMKPLTINLAGENIAYGIDTTTTVDAETTDPETQDNLSENSTISTVVVDTPFPKADLSLTQTDSRDPILSNSRFSYTLTIQNAGPNLAQRLMVINTLPNGVTFDSVNGTDWQCNESRGQIICTLDNLASGAAKAITLNVIAPNIAGSLTNQATVSAITLDSAKDNNTSSETTQVEAAQADLSITQTDSSDPVLTNTDFSYTLTVNNAGQDMADNVKVTNILPEGVSFISANGTDWICNDSGNTVKCQLVSLSMGAANPIILNVTAPDAAAGSITNTATISATTLDPEEENNSVSETTVVKAPPLSPTAQSLTLEVGDTVTIFNIEGGNGQRTLTEKPDSDLVNFSYSDNDILLLTGINRGTTRLVISDSGQPPSTATLNITVRKLTCGNAQGIDQAGNLINQTGACFTGTISVTSDKTCDNEPECSRSGNHLTVVQSDEIGITAHIDVAPQHIGSSAELLILAIQKHSGTQLSYYRDAQGDWQPLEQGNLSQIQAFEQYDTLPETLDITVIPKGYVTNLISGEFIIYTGYRLEDGSVIFNGQEPLHFIVANSLAVDKAGNPLPDPSAYFTNEISIDSESEGKPVKLLPND
ncbi:MAG: DUF11 domain-containing protein, partial [Candidatus Parabeggiatoa sp.]|nr:DUF11 domain-containing protein [Candidatus Parabeggiatoa sp.]